MDADHLAAIDGLTRFNAEPRPALARWCGTLFSIGHGGVVILIAISAGETTTRYVLPGWARDFGDWVSIGFLILLGLLNLSLVRRTPPDDLVRPFGLRSRLLSRLTSTAHPIAMAGLGALFAVSLDTMTEASLFAATAARFGGWARTATLGGLFTLGMLLVDGVNGAWVAALLLRADHRARSASRLITVFVALMTLAVAALGILRYYSAASSEALESSGLYVGALLVLPVALCSLFLGRWFFQVQTADGHSRRARAAQVDGRA
jgi:nickel/cobalt transporter (NiCoT) family protein